jgi:hypothetical protein
MDFDMEPSNVDMEMANDPSGWGQEEEEEEDIEVVVGQKVDPTDPSDQA